jgi:hypothetical protein
MKIINIEVRIPDDYKYIALEPFGTWMAFKNKPVIVEEQEGDDTLYYWGVQKDELEIANCGPEKENWRDSLQEI